MVNLERSNTVKTHTKRARKIVRRPVRALPASNEPPGPLQDKPVWGMIEYPILLYDNIIQYYILFNITKRCLITSKEGQGP